MHVHRPSTINVQQWLRHSSFNPGATGRTGKDPWACRGQEHTRAAAGGRREASVGHDCTIPHTICGMFLCGAGKMGKQLGPAHALKVKGKYLEVITLVA